MSEGLVVTVNFENNTDVNYNNFVVAVNKVVSGSPVGLEVEH